MSTDATLTGGAAAALVLWLVVSAAGVWVWVPRLKAGLDRTLLLLGTVIGTVLGTGVVALLGALAPPLPPGWSWLAVGLAAAGTVLSGGAVVVSLLALAGPPTRSASARVQRTVLRGGTWIGALERLGVLATILAGWPEGIAAVVAIKAFARYPELRTAQESGAIERFIIGTFASLGWAAACAGVALVLIR